MSVELALVNFRDKQIAPPRTWEVFEDLTLSLFRSIWADPLAQRNGRKGQPQHGVDVFGSPHENRAVFRGVQCKGKDQAYGAKPTVKELSSELEKAESFVPPLEHWTFATTAPVDARVQQAARELSKERSSRGAFGVSVLGWEDIQRLVAEYPHVLEEFYPEHAFDLREVVRQLKVLPTGADVRALLKEFAEASSKSGASSGPEPAWLPLEFVDGRDLGPALMGRPLGPADVGACPRLPEADAIVYELERAYSVRLVGEPGAGKSICALQAARTFSDRGYRVVRLRNASTDAIEFAPQRDGVATLHIVDDAHLVSPIALKGAEEQVGPKQLLLSAYTQMDGRETGRGSIVLDSKRAVATIAGGLRATRETVLDAVRRLDDRVGDHLFDESIDDRLDHAAEASDYPWQFCFILGGGWRRSRRIADNARAAGADLALAAASIRQIAFRDSRSGRDALIGLLTAAGLEQSESEVAFQWLISERLLLGPDDLRCPHQRFAAVVLGEILRGQNEIGRRTIARLVYLTFEDPEVSLVGLRSLLHQLRFSNGDDWRRVLEHSKLSGLVERCWHATRAERAYALLIFSDLSSYYPGWPRSLLGDRIDQLAGWASEPEEHIGYAVGDLLRSVNSQDSSLAEEVVARIDAGRIAAAVGTVTPQSAFNLAELIAGIGSVRAPQWKTHLNAVLDRQGALRLASDWPLAEPVSVFAKFCHALCWVDESLALDLVDHFMPTATRILANDPVGGSRRLRDITWFVLRVFDPLGVYVGKLAPTARQKSLGRQMCARLQAPRVARQLSALSKREFQDASFFLGFLREAAPRKYAATVSALDWTAIDATIGDDWSCLPHEVEVFLGVCFALERARTPIAALILRNLHRIDRLPPRIALMAPAAAYDHVAAGKRVLLASHGHYAWKFGSGVLALFSQDRPELVEALLGPFEKDAGAILSNKNPSWYREALGFIRLLRQVAPTSLSRVLSHVDANTAEIGWAACLRESGPASRTVTLLVEVSLSRTDGIGAMSRGLRARFPRTSIPREEDLESVTILR